MHRRQEQAVMGRHRWPVEDLVWPDFDNFQNRSENYFGI